MEENGAVAIGQPATAGTIEIVVPAGVKAGTTFTEDVKVRAAQASQA